jgi:hypothetical protein
MLAAHAVMPAKVGTQASGVFLAPLGSRFRGNDDEEFGETVGFPLSWE